VSITVGSGNSGAGGAMAITAGRSTAASKAGGKLTITAGYGSGGVGGEGGLLDLVAGEGSADSRIADCKIVGGPCTRGIPAVPLVRFINNTANRLVSYASRQGISRYQIVHGNDLQGQIGRDAIASAVRANGGQVTGIEGYPLSQAGIQGSAARIASATTAGGAQAIMMTAGINADLPILATALPDAGVNPSETRFIGLTRWSAAPQALALPGLQGGLFAIPDQSQSAIFESRYAAAFGSQPHPLAGLAYDGIAAIGALAARGDSAALTKQSLTAPQGFQGTSGIFRFQQNGLNERGLSVATIQNNQNHH
jgi:hypothetical protein